MLFLIVIIILNYLRRYFIDDIYNFYGKFCKILESFKEDLSNRKIYYVNG